MAKLKGTKLALLAAAANISLNFAVMLIVGILLGKTIDRCLGSNPWGMMVGAVVGFIAAFWSVVKIAAKGR